MITGKKLAKKVDVEFPKPSKSARKLEAKAAKAAKAREVTKAREAEGAGEVATLLHNWRLFGLLTALFLIITLVAFGICWLVYAIIEH